MSMYSGPTAEDLDRIPAELKACPQWVLWRGADRIDTTTGEVTGLNKTPIDPQTLRHASTTDQQTWGTFAQCVAALPVALEEWEHANPGAYRGGGLGFVFTSGDPYCGVDLDHCRDPDTGEIAAWAQRIIETLASYTEVTPSATGLHVLVQGVLPPTGRKKGAIEMYSHARFFTMTGWHLPSTTRSIEARLEVLTALHAATFGTPQGTHPQNLSPPLTSPPPFLEDAALLAKARAAKNGPKVEALWAGDTTGYPSPSEADLGLCLLLAFWTSDPTQLDRLFRQSGRMRDKWDERHGAQTYGAQTIAKALELQREHYTAAPHWGLSSNGSTPGPEPADPYACPELPSSAAIDAHQAADASLFLDDYIAFSRIWAPRAYEGFHEAVALFVLSTTAARRVRIALGGGMYTSLYIALAARTTLYTKSTAADIGLELLRRTGLRYLLADDDATPQALLRAMAGSVDAQYAVMTDLAQRFEQHRFAFSAQRGWFYEEWGQHLDAMMEKRGGVMASFRSLLRRFDDHKEEYIYSTIGRGREVLTKPYLTLLANVTPADLQPHVKKDSTLWRDGFIARMAFVSPPEDTSSDAEFPRGERIIPAPLIADLDSWHRKLGIPQCEIQQDLDAKGTPKEEKYTARRDPLPETTYTLSEEVWKSFYAYDRALRALIRQHKTEYLDGSYARFPGKALRIAALLASLHDNANNHTIWPTQWARAQEITERWRRYLHALVKQVQSVSATEETPTAKAEQRIEEVVRQHGALSVREIHQRTKFAYADIAEHCATLVAAEVLTAEKTPRTTKYRLTHEP
jgi:putative DNA primase/helicase